MAIPWTRRLSIIHNTPLPRAQIARRFSSTSSQYQKLRVNPARLLSDLHHTCQWGTGARWGTAPTETGMSRLALSDADRKARDWFVETTKSLGCTITIDEMGSIFAVRPGRKTGAATFAGSHLDTQPSGGRYDGILGVLAGVEMLKVLNENKVETEYPVGVINWTNEEGARFPISMVASGVWADKTPLQTAHNLMEIGGKATQKSELQRIGYLGSTPASHKSMPIAAHFELHIEQGPILEQERRKIGVVLGAQSYRWYTVEVTGRDCHTGTTPLAARADAMLAASKMIVESNRIASSLSGLASTGVLTLTPGSVNTVPGTVRFSLDIRARQDDIVDAIEAEVKASFVQLAQPCSVEIQRDFTSPAIEFDKNCISCIHEAAQSLFTTRTEELTKEMVSGAGHDSVNTNYICPTAMIFIPCKEGVSHNPREYSEPEDCAIGADVLLNSILNYDKLRASKASS
ncbi:putative beta-alanine synthase [Microthyrium microscopicum]|uniref:Putative beta-alanine synthase n=1 Tax=Microthyrium microscopicum TaxID=703497 RepID=A0A6A6U328_9PEZI|nr:putative beta-alanine synthase [Microthyrium microscopicum]